MYTSRAAAQAELRLRDDSQIWKQMRDTKTMMKFSEAASVWPIYRRKIVGARGDEGIFHTHQQLDGQHQITRTTDAPIRCSRVDGARCWVIIFAGRHPRIELIALRRNLRRFPFFERMQFQGAEVNRKRKTTFCHNVRFVLGAMPVAKVTGK